MVIRTKLLLLCVSSMLVIGCATVNPKPDYERASNQIERAIGQDITFDPEDDAYAEDIVAGLLQDGLTAAEAVQLCILNNPKLQAGYLRIGIGRADVVQSGLFSNPSMALSLRFPDEGGLANFEVSLAQNIAELWQIRHRKRAAERNLEQTILAVAREASVTALEARSAYLQAVKADREAALTRENLTIAERLVELAGARKEAGSGNEVEVNFARAERMGLDVKQRTADADATEAHATLAKLLGLTIRPDELKLLDLLSEPAELPFTGEQVIAAAREHRLDLRAADASVQAAHARVEYERSRFLKDLELGISMERDERRSRGGRDWLAETASASAEAGQLTLPSFQRRESVPTDYVTGPTLALELPLFDQNQAQVARAEYELMQAAYFREAVDREIVQEAWTAHARARSSLENAKFMKDELLPLREKGLSLAHEAYRVGSGTLLTVLDAQRTLLDARAGYVDAQVSAALAAIDLERVAGQPYAALAAPREQARSMEIRP